ncbi:MAG: thioredoxin [Cycloclasticus sp. symbiont of Poecilosclerida sp. N]|nr:MAG: thioredoxin [Cycloclasticus sp. symbiont of Poecilosclerida sp. N]
MARVLYYVYDPMCSWCWAFNKTWSAVQAQLPSDIELRYILGGLAPDTDEPMPMGLQKTISAVWRTIQQRVPGTQFNHAFWTECSPRRSTYPASRAIIAAKKMDSSVEKKMLLAIQHAYYLKAKNPSNADVLIECAEGIGLDTVEFKELLNKPSTQQQLLADIRFARKLGVNSFPSLVLETLGGLRVLDYEYTQPAALLSQLCTVTE